MNITASEFQRTLLSWFDQFGRKELPWQIDKTPYRVWISEIMLQQTQVATVIPYYERFMSHFPDLAALANADEDAVLHLWAGLGYYSRARNLHRAARIIMQDFNGEFPSNLTDLLKLPGIGQSTAGAILSIAFKQRATILDGNVKRVLARLHAITTPINEKETENKLWDLAVSYTPAERSADYTQAIMDLGATLCTRKKAACEQCPFNVTCKAYAEGIVDLLPQKTAAKSIPTRSATMLVIKQNNKIFLQKRPPMGIWGGLWSLPELSGEPKTASIRAFMRQQFHISAKPIALTPFRHTFSHYHLMIHPILIELAQAPVKVMDGDNQIWYNPFEPEAVGLPKPIQHIIRGAA